MDENKSEQYQQKINLTFPACLSQKSQKEDNEMLQCFCEVGESKKKILIVKNKEEMKLRNCKQSMDKQCEADDIMIMIVY